MAFFQFQGTLSADAPSYVERRADRELFTGLTHGEFCYVLTSRQMGKSSLMARTARSLQNRGCAVVGLDLTQGGTQLSPEQWYDSLVIQIGRQLRIESALEDFWLDQDRLGPVQRLFTALHDVVLPRLPAGSGGSPGSLVIFIDEIDVVRSLPFLTDEFFGAIRECYNARVSDPQFSRLTFCLLGVATPAELMRDPTATPFQFGRRVELTDFTSLEAAVLSRGLGGSPAEALGLVARVLDWTHGHPYLTQRLCQAIADQGGPATPDGVDALCQQLFLGPAVRQQEPNLTFVREHLLRAGERRGDVLRLYHQVRAGQSVPDDEANPDIEVLRLAGLVRVERGLLVVRNRIYAEVFDEAWVRENLPPAAEPQGPAIAVLPFVDLSSEKTAYLADGLTDELIQELGRVPGLRVVSRNSVFQLRGQPVDPRRVGVQLGAVLVVEGSVRQLGSRLRVAADLIAVADRRRLWSGSYRHGVEEINQVPRELARAIADQVQTDFGRRTPSTRLLRQQTTSQEGYNLYLKGLYHWNQRTDAAVRRSLTLFQAALALDPHFAPALAGLADAYIILGIYNFWSPVLAYPQAREAAIRALELDDSLAQAHTALACTNAVFDRDWARAEHSFRRAIQLNPSYATAHQWLAVNCLTPVGRHEEALAALRTAQELDPLSISVPTSVALALHLAGRHDEAIEQSLLTTELDEDFWLPHLFLGWAYEQKSRFRDALASLQTAAELSHGDPAALASLCHALAASGQRAEANAQLEKLLALAKTRYVPAAEIALAQLGLGNTETAVEWMDRARTEHSFRLIYLRVDPRFAPIRNHRSFERWLKAGA